MADKEQIDKSISLIGSILRETEEGHDLLFGEGYSDKHKEEMVRIAGAAAIDYRLAKIESVLQEINGKLDR